ncbi:hypothetical protein AVEN_52345-1 [Araneus ventricosus]|uniref:Uncharacterized protein n=1 Tax=Araneus ventricosus TaxID=182803 RepID=A0A4Y2QRW6_ARAVE|nr:hypothetical protein AVEN_52345-1 [Araneus ventricosus]
MTRTTHELSHPLQTSAPYQWEDVWPLYMIERATCPIHGGSSVKSDYELRTLQPRSRVIVIKPFRSPKDLVTISSNCYNRYCLKYNVLCESIKKGLDFRKVSSAYSGDMSHVSDFYALLLCGKSAAKLPHQVCHDRLISRKITFAASVRAIWDVGREFEKRRETKANRE